MAASSDRVALRNETRQRAQLTAESIPSSQINEVGKPRALSFLSAAIPGPVQVPREGCIYQQARTLAARIGCCWPDATPDRVPAINQRLAV